MSSLLFENVHSQYIDNNGKTRMLVYDFEGIDLSLMTSPIPPLDFPLTKKITEVSLRVALGFIKQKGLKITLQDGNDTQGIQGLWIETSEENPGIYYGYIPIEVSKSIKEIPYADKNDPFRTDSSSDLSDFRQSRKIAEFLKQYTLFSYAKDPENFGEDSFVVIPDHVYDIASLNKRLTLDTDVMYQDQKLIVPSEETRRRLLSFLRVSLINDNPGVMKMKDATTMDGFYQTISDFRTTDNQLVFVNKNGLLRWRHEHSRIEHNTKVTNITNETLSEPYFYRNPKIRKDQLMIVQNVVDGNMDNAISVSYKWLKDHINIGYRPSVPNNVNDISYVVYSDMGEIEKVKRVTKESVSLLRYENDSYAALLFFG